jgi:hypothetical protein
MNNKWSLIETATVPRMSETENLENLIARATEHRELLIEAAETPRVSEQMANTYSLTEDASESRPSDQQELLISATDTIRVSEQMCNPYSHTEAASVLKMSESDKQTNIAIERATDRQKLLIEAAEFPSMYEQTHTPTEEIKDINMSEVTDSANPVIEVVGQAGYMNRLTVAVIEDIFKNERLVNEKGELQQYLEDSKEIVNWSKMICLSKCLNVKDDKTSHNQCYFRKMPRIDERLVRKPIKRLQLSPKIQEKMKDQKLKSQKIIQRLICKLMEEDVGLVMNNLRMKGMSTIDDQQEKLENRANKDGKSSLDEDGKTSPEEECLTMLGKLEMNAEIAPKMTTDKENPMPKLEELELSGTKNESNGMEDHWDEFSSLEEQEDMIKQLEAAENELMIEYENKAPLMKENEVEIEDENEPVKIANVKNFPSLGNIANIPPKIAEIEDRVNAKSISIEKTPSPPPNKRKKTRKFDNDVPHQDGSPALRKNCATTPTSMTTTIRKNIKYTPPKKTKLEKMFTVGSASTPKTPVGGGRVLEAKRIMEDQIRKTKRDNKVKEFRPLISTPTEKRSRGEDGEWETPPRPLSIPRTPATPGRRLQTPIQQFLIKQSLEDRRKLMIERREKEERSSSPAKPVKKKPQAVPSARTDNLKKLQMKPGKVSSILKYFENAEDARESSKLLVSRSARYNNNMLSPPQLTQTEPGSTQPVQQMAPQPNFDRNDAQPTATSALGHVPIIKTSAPMNDCHLTPPRKSGIVSHL